MKRKTKIVIGVVAAVVVVALAAAGVTQAGKPKGTRVRTAKVERKDLVSLITANGTVQARTKVDLSANIMGQITALNVEEGDIVKKGDLLLVIDQARYAAAVDGSKASLESLQAELARVREAAAQAERDLSQAQAQHREGIIASADLERAESQLVQARAAIRRAERLVEQSRADLKSSSDALDKTEIRAPMDGVVTRRNIEQGEVVVTGTMNNPGTVLMTISDMSTIEAVLEVDQTDVPQLRVGQKATVLIDAFPDQPFPGEVTEIGSSPIRGTSQLGTAATGTDYEVKVTLQKHPERVRPGLTVTADITTNTAKGVLSVPIGALVLRAPEAGKPGAATPAPVQTPTPAPGEPESVASRTKDIEGVYVVVGGGAGEAGGAARFLPFLGGKASVGKAAFVPVKTGTKGELEVEVTEGLEGGEEVVIGPFRALRELAPDKPVVIDNAERPGLEQ